MSVLLLYSKQFQASRNLIMGLDGMIDVIFELATSIEHSGLINTTWVIRNCYLRCGSNHMSCDLTVPFLQSAFCSCDLGCGSNRLCFENSRGGEVHSYIIVGTLPL